METDQTLLKPDFKHCLNPIQLNIKSIENLYINPNRADVLQPTMVRYDLLGDGVFVESRRQATWEAMDISYRHVFLFGLDRQIDLKEHFEGRRVEIEVHDRDEVRLDAVKKSVEYLELKEPELIEKEDDPKKKKKGGAAAKKAEPAKKKDDGKKDAKKKKDKKKDYGFDEFEELPVPKYYQREFGTATFFLRDLLNPYSLFYELQAPICPRRVFVDDDRDNLDLNSTARKQGREIVQATNYFGCVIFLNQEFIIKPGATFSLPN